MDSKGHENRDSRVAYICISIFSFSVGIIRILGSLALDILTGIGFTYPVPAISPKPVSTWLSPWAGFKTRSPPRQKPNAEPHLKKHRSRFKILKDSTNRKMSLCRQFKRSRDSWDPRCERTLLCKNPFSTPHVLFCNPEVLAIVMFLWVLVFGSVDFKIWVSACRALDA